MATTPELHEPQIEAARAQAWHQAGEALLTLEAARTWLNNYGLVLFAPRGGSLGAPAPSLVEATLGSPKPSATLAETDTARTLTARLVGEGSALPLNLLGGPGDLPDFLVSAQAFPFVFTLRGDKGWKRPPETSGAVAVTPLGLRVYELLAERGAMPIAEIVPEIGREVTESAIARALSDLWQMLRVIPVLQQGEGETLWELSTARFLKGIKAGANAGQPTALSALVSLYLSQSYIASEEEIAGFLSPLTARSRVRDVLHGLVAGRQLSEGVVNGKAVLYVPDALPDFAQFAEPEPETEAVTGEAGESSGEPTSEEAAAAPERIRRFGGDKERPQDRNLRGKPVRREGTGAGRSFGARPSRGPASDRNEGGERPARRPFNSRSDAPGRPPRRPEGDGERRSFSSDRPAFKRPARRDDAGAGEGRAPRGDRPDRPSFSRPWNEDRGSRPPRSRDAEGSARPDRPARPFGDRPARPFGDRPARPSGDRPGRPPREDRGDRPARPFRDRAEGRPPRREFPQGDRPAYGRRDAGQGVDSAADRRPAAPRGDRPQRPFRDRNAEGGSSDRPFRPRTGGPREGGFTKRPPFGDRPGNDRPGGGFRRDDRPARAGGGDRGDRRPSFGGGAGRPARSGSGPGDRPAPRGGFRPGGSRPSGDRPSGFRPGGPGGRSGGPGSRPGPKFGGKPNRPPRPDRPARTPRPEDEA